jgi:hypothetical protein
VLLVVAVVSTSLAGTEAHAGQLGPSMGRISLSIDSTIPPGGSFAVNWNKGTLTLTDGSRHEFAVKGLGIQGNEGSLVELEAKGEVYHLPTLEDFAGTYRRTIGELSPERDTNTVMIQNQHGVIMVVTVTVDRARGNIRLVPSPTGVAVTFEH